MHDPTSLLVRQLDRAFLGPAWHGPTLMGSLRGLDPKAASWRPGAQRHNAWELMVHAAYWKYRICRLVTDEPPRQFGIAGSNFFPRPDPDSRQPGTALWQEDLQRLSDWHGRLKSAVAALDPRRLAEAPGRGRHNFEQLIAGAADHDTYHAGQIRLLRRLREG